MNIDEMNLDELMALLNQIEEVRKYNKWLDFKPYPFQKQMFEAGAGFRSRYACLANRIGKTFAGAFELAVHLTGCYPSQESHGWDWNGIKYDYPILAWGIGITSNSTRTILQKEVLGTESGKDLAAIGTGSIPRDYIDFKTLERDGNTILSVKVKHHTNGVFDGYSTLEFRSTQQGVHTLMGQSVDYIWLDEEDWYKSIEIFSQCSTRTATKDKGRVLITATPEAGFTELIRKFEETPELFIYNAGWDDAKHEDGSSHLKEDVKAELMAGLPEWEIPMRTQGVPSRGSGAIFPIDDSEITVEEFNIPGDWMIVAGIDFGKSVDPSVVMFAAKDSASDRYYIFKEHYLDSDRSVQAISQVILDSEYPNIPCIIPHDGASVIEGGGNETRATLLRQLGVNVCPTTFSNPWFIQNKISNVHAKHQGREGGLHWMNFQFGEGNLKIFEDCWHFFKDKRGFFWKQKGGKTVSATTNDDTIDASRYALLSVDLWGVPAGQCKRDFQDFNNGFSEENESGLSIFQ